MRGLFFIFLALSLNVHAASTSKQEAQVFSCEGILSKKIPTKVYQKTFVTRFRGQELEIPYQMNRRRLAKTKDVAVVVPGLNKPSFEEMLVEMGKGGEQAISMDLTNINSVGPFLAPTPEEDAKIVHDLLVHLGLEKKSFKNKLYIINHSRGAIVSSRFILAHHKKFNIAGVIKFNPYVGWIPNYHAQSHGESLSSGLRMVEAMVGHLPAAGFATKMAASVVEGVGASLAMSAMRLFVDIHNRDVTYKALKDVIHTDDELILENIRQKLIGMEDAEIHEDFDLMRDLEIPVIIIRSDNDELVPAAQIDGVAVQYGYPVLVFQQASHYLPYEQPQASGQIVHQILVNLRAGRALDAGIELR